MHIRNRFCALPQPVLRLSVSLYLRELKRVCVLADAAPARCCVEALRTDTLMEDRRFQRHLPPPTADNPCQPQPPRGVIIVPRDEGEHARERAGCSLELSGARVPHMSAGLLFAS